jgi:hypothetical protein
MPRTLVAKATNSIAVTLTGLLCLAACSQPVDAAGEAQPIAENMGVEEAFQQVADNQSSRQRNTSRGNTGSRHSVMDSNALGRPAAALTLSVPEGWRAQSAVRWDNINGQCSFAIASPMFRLSSPDNTASIEQFPGFLVSTSEQSIRSRGSQPGDFCQYGTATSGEEFARATAIPFLRPQSRITNIRALQLDPQIATLAQRMQQAASGYRIVPYQVEVSLVNSDATVEKITLGGVIMVGQQIMQGVVPLIVNQNLLSFGVRARPDQLAQTENFSQRVRSSIQPNPEWSTAVNAIQNRLTRPNFASNGSSRAPNNYGGPQGSDSTVGNYNSGQIGTGVNSDGAQRQRINSLYEQERCADGRVVSIHVGC